MDNMNGMTPVGLVEGEFKVATSSIPNYQTKRLGLTQYTPNRVTSWLGNYNDDMRKIDNFSSSIGAYVEKVIEDGDATHQELSRKITDTVSMIAAVERRVDENFTEHEEIRTNIQQVETGAAQKIVESEKRLVEMIQQNNTSTSSTLAYVQQQVTDNDAKHTLAESQLNQRVHVVEDEVAAIKENDTAFRSELNDVKSTVTTHTSSIAELEGDVAAAQGDATTANNRANANAISIAALNTSQTAQDATIATLETRVGELASVGEAVNALKNLGAIKILDKLSTYDTHHIRNNNQSINILVENSHKKMNIQIFDIENIAETVNFTIKYTTNFKTYDMLYIPSIIIQFNSGGPGTTAVTRTINVDIQTRASGSKTPIVIIGNICIGYAGYSPVGVKYNITNNANDRMIVNAIIKNSTLKNIVTVNHLYK